jgi:2-polyprenyl-3-methyl-5-hydroxy-6-metoxy-1,4-benzoquinol methylase
MVGSYPPRERSSQHRVDGLTLVDPQCHFGLDTLSWARRDAQVTGLDFSPPAVAAARMIAERAGIEAEFIEANVYDAVEALGGRRFDIVYTGLGALNWLPDIERWARTMVELMASGGRFYLAELALAAAGLRIEWLHEHDYTVDPRWPFLCVDADRHYRMPPDMPSLPLIYSLRASL